MAVVDRPLYADSARGRIKSTIIFYEHGPRFVFRSLTFHRTTRTIPQDTQRSAYSQALTDWLDLSEADKDLYRAQAVPPLNAVNVYLQEVLSPMPPPPAFFTEQIQLFLLPLSLRWSITTTNVTRPLSQVTEQATEAPKTAHPSLTFTTSVS